MSKIKFAIVGLGHIGARHAHIVQKNPLTELVAVCDILPQEKIAANFAGIPYFTSYHKMLKNHPEIDIVTIATPNGLHAEQALRALEYRKYVLIEKPMTTSKIEAERVIFKALEVSKKVFLVMQNRYSPPALWLKSLMDEDILGKIFMVQINCFWNRNNDYYEASDWRGTKKLDGGILFTQFSHFIDMMYWLFGDIHRIQTKLQNFQHQNSTEFEDSGVSQFQFVNGGLGTINFTTATWAKNFESSITIIAEKGTVRVGGQYMNEVEYCDIENYEIPELSESNPPNDYGKYKGSAANHHFVIENVANALLGKNTTTTNMLEGMKVVEIIERIYKNAKK